MTPKRQYRLTEDALKQDGSLNRSMPMGMGDHIHACMLATAACNEHQMHNA